MIRLIVAEDQALIRAHAPDVIGDTLSSSEGMEIEQNSVTSDDGTAIAFETIGKGPALIVIPGVLSTAASLSKFAASVGRAFTVHTINRRGRGHSGPQGQNYSIEKEVADVRAVQNVTGAAYVFGHSYGGLIALESARNNAGLKALALYEPCLSVNRSLPMTWTASYEQRLSQNRPLDAFVGFSKATGPEAARKTPAWLMKLLMPAIVPKHELRDMLTLLPENLREHAQIAQLDNTYENYRDISASTLIMYGGRSGLEWVERATLSLTEVLPQHTTKRFAQLDHFGPSRARFEEVAEAVREHFQDRADIA